MRVKPAVTVKIEDEAIPKPQVLNCIRMMTQEAWDGETEEIKDEVMKLWNTQSKRESKSKEAMTPEDYAAYVYWSHQKLSLTALFSAYKDADVQITKFMQMLGEATGGCITVLFGACDPNAGGKVQTRGFHLGKDSEGNNFVASNPNYMDKTLKPFTSFVKKVIPPEVRKARALKKCIKEDKEDNKADASPTAPLPPPPKLPVAEPQPEPHIPPPPPLPTAPLPPPPKSPVAKPQPESRLPPPPPSPPSPQPEPAELPAPRPQPQPVNIDTRQTNIEDPKQNGINDERCEDGSARNNTDDTATHGDDDSIAAPAKMKVAHHKCPISEVETVVSTREKRTRVVPAAREALTMAELAARQNGMGDETVNEAVKGKPKKVSKKVVK